MTVYLPCVIVQFFIAIILPPTATGWRSASAIATTFSRNDRVTKIQQCVHTKDFEYSNCGSNIQLQENLREISFPFPSGLLITEGADASFCLLERNSVSLRPYCKRVLELREALSTTTCAYIIDKAELYAASNGGWTSDRHSAYPTTDLPLEAIFGKFSSVHGLVNGHILPQMASFFQLNEDYLSIGELFVAKYEFGADKQSGLGAHVDGTPWSFVVSLNSPINEFTGGGTHFLEEAVTYRPSDVGTAVIFSGKNKHEGVSITSGTRYILTGFCNYADPNISGKELYASFDEKFDGFAFSGHSREWGPPYYNPKIDGDRDLMSNGERALVSRTESGCDLTTLDHEADHIGNGVRIGDILKAIWISDDSGDDSVPMHYKDSMRDPVTVSPENSFNSDKRVVGETLHGSNRGRFVMLDGLTSKEIKLLVFLSGKAAQTHGCLILVKSDCAADEDDANNEEQRNLQYNAWRLLSTGKYWSYDEALLDLIS